jgi:DeoR family transcriptional regulator, catabolite repression regulator
MLYRNSDDDQYGPIAFLEGSASRQSRWVTSDERHRMAQSPEKVTLTEPAERVMTDFTWKTPITVAADRFIGDALREMIHAGVRALIVMRGEVVVGLITSYDIQGDRPLQFQSHSGFTNHSDIEVGHIMTPWEVVPTLDVPWVSLATVGDVVERFQRRGDSHFLVVEYLEQGGAFVRGMFSRTEVQRQLGATI